MRLSDKGEKEVRIWFRNSRDNIDYYLDRLPLKKNTIGDKAEHDCEKFYISSQDLKDLSNIQYLDFLDLLFSYPLHTVFDAIVDESDIDEAIYHSACLIDAGGERDFLKQSSSMFNYKIRLIKWFINRGNFKVAKKVITFHKYQFTSNLLFIMLSSVFQVPLFIATTIGLVVDFHIPKLFLGLFLVLVLYGLVSIWVKTHDSRFQFLLLAELLPAKVAIASVAAHVAILSSDQLVNILAISDPIRSFVFIGFGVSLTILAINYRLLKIPLSARESLVRSFVATIHFFWFSFLANMIVHLIWFLNVDQWNLADTYLCHADKVQIFGLYNGIIVFPILLVNGNSLCVLFSILINQVIDDKTIA